MFEIQQIQQLTTQGRGRPVNHGIHLQGGRPTCRWLGERFQGLGSDTLNTKPPQAPTRRIGRPATRGLTHPRSWPHCQGIRWCFRQIWRPDQTVTKEHRREGAHCSIHLRGQLLRHLWRSGFLVDSGKGLLVIASLMPGLSYDSREREERSRADLNLRRTRTARTTERKRRTDRKSVV